MIIKGIIPVAMAGVRGIYGLVLSIIIMSGIHTDKDYTQYNGFMHLGAGLCCGAAQFASGIAVGVVGESGTQAVVRQMKLFAPVVLILIFTEVGGLLRLDLGAAPVSVSPPANLERRGNKECTCKMYSPPAVLTICHRPVVYQGLLAAWYGIYVCASCARPTAHAPCLSSRVYFVCLPDPPARRSPYTA